MINYWSNLSYFKSFSYFFLPKVQVIWSFLVEKRFDFVQSSSSLCWQSMMDMVKRGRSAWRRFLSSQETQTPFTGGCWTNNPKGFFSSTALMWRESSFSSRTLRISTLESESIDFRSVLVQKQLFFKKIWGWIWCLNPDFWLKVSDF